MREVVCWRRSQPSSVSDSYQVSRASRAVPDRAAAVLLAVAQHDRLSKELVSSIVAGSDDIATKLTESLVRGGHDEVEPLVRVLNRMPPSSKLLPCSGIARQQQTLRHEHYCLKRGVARPSGLLKSSSLSMFGLRMMSLRVGASLSTHTTTTTRLHSRARMRRFTHGDRVKMFLLARWTLSGQSLTPSRSALAWSSFLSPTSSESWTCRAGGARGRARKRISMSSSAQYAGNRSRV